MDEAMNESCQELSAYDNFEFYFNRAVTYYQNKNISNALHFIDKALASNSIKKKDRVLGLILKIGMLTVTENQKDKPKLDHRLAMEAGIYPKYRFYRLSFTSATFKALPYAEFAGHARELLKDIINNDKVFRSIDTIQKALS